MSSNRRLLRGRMGEYAYVYYASLPLPPRLLSLAVIHSVHTLKSGCAAGGSRRTVVPGQTKTRRVCRRIFVPGQTKTSFTALGLNKPVPYRNLVPTPTSWSVKRGERESPQRRGPQQRWADRSCNARIAPSPRLSTSTRRTTPACVEGGSFVSWRTLMH